MRKKVRVAGRKNRIKEEDYIIGEKIKLRGTQMAIHKKEGGQEGGLKKVSKRREDT